MSNGLSTSDIRDAQLERIIDEAIAAAEGGQPLPIEAIAARHPEFSDELRELLPAAEMLLHIGHPSTAPLAISALPLATLPLATLPLGDFRLIREIGKGGMGVVYEAEQLSLGRRVALKVLPLASMLDNQRLARFQIEARAVATLSHPHIVPVYAVGSDRGVHYYAMQLIEGRSLAQVIEQQRMRKPASMPRSSHISTTNSGETAAEVASTVPDRDTREYFRTAARLMAEAAEALDHAHRRGILHRDVKPANLLVDDSGKLWVADFGLAQLAGHSQVTLTGDLVGTLRYMSPEQALGKRAAVDARADVYALGATLFELLTLQPVFADADREALLRKLALEEPPAARRVNHHVPLDLDTIVAKSLQREPADRYLTAGDLAGDLRRYLAEQPILARPATRVERIVKYFRRRPTVAAAIAVSLMVVSVTLLFAALLINRARREAMVALERTSELLYVADMTAACQAWEKNWADKVREILEKHRPRDGEPDRRGHEWFLLERQTRPPESYSLAGHDGAVNELALLPDRKHLASVGDDGTLRIWDPDSRDCQKVVKLSPRPLYSVAASPDGRYIAAGGIDSIVYLCDRRNAYDARALHRGEYSIESLAFSDDGERLAAGYRYEEVCLLNLRGQLIGRVPSRARLKSLEYAANTDSWRLAHRLNLPDGRQQRFIQQWSGDLAKLERQFGASGTEDAGPQFSASFPSDQFLVGGDEYKCNAVIFEVATGRPIGRTPRSRDNLLCMALSPDGKQLALGYRNGLVECFPISDDEGTPQFMEAPRVFLGCEGQLIDMEFVNDSTLATSGADGRVRIWAINTQRQLIRPPRDGELAGMAVSPDGEALLCWYRDKVFIMATTGGRFVELAANNVASTNPMAAWSPAGDVVLVWTPTTTEPVRLFGPGGQFIASVESPSRILNAAVSPDGQLLATVGDDLRIWNIRTRMEVYSTPLLHELPTGWSVAFSHDGRYLAYGGDEPTIVIMDVQNHRKHLELASEEDVYSMAFSPDDSKLATGHGDSLVRLWDLKAGRLEAELAGHAGAVRNASFAPESDLLLTASDDGTMRLWSLRHGGQFGIVPFPRQPIGEESLHSSPVRISISGDGTCLAISAISANGRQKLAVLDLLERDDRQARNGIR